MNVLIAGLLCFAVAFAAHVLLWRLLRPARGVMPLLKLFAAGFAAGAVALLAEGPRFGLALSPPEAFRAGLLYVSLALAYVILYSAIDEDSPSTTIVKYAALAGEAGCAEEDLAVLITDEVVAASRLDSVVGSGAVVRDGERYRLGPSGVFWNRLLGFFHRLYRLPRSG
jgi:hypothetical protein